MSGDYTDYIFSDGKASVRAASTGNVNVESPESVVDNVTLEAGDRVLLKDQDNAAENGLYQFNGESEPMTRARDANQPGELSGGAITYVEEGDTNGGSAFVMNVPGDIVLGVTELTFAEAYDAGEGGGGGGGGDPLLPTITNAAKLSAIEMVVEGTNLTQADAQNLSLGFSNGSMNAYNPAGPFAEYNAGNGIEDIIWTDTSITFSTVYLPTGTFLGLTLLDSEGNELASFIPG